MARNNIKVGVGSVSAMPPTFTVFTEAGASAILPGEPVVAKAVGSQYGQAAADGTPVIGTDLMLGISQGASTHTASADGTVEVYLPIPGTKYAAKAKTPASFNTAAEIKALVGNDVLFDLTNGVYTVDESTSHSTNNGLYLEGGNPDTQEVYFKIRSTATFLS